MDKSWADAHLPLVISVLKGQGSFKAMFDDDADEARDEARKEPKNILVIGAGPAAGSVYRMSYYTDLSRIPEGSIALVDISGPIMKNGGMCSYGSVEKAEMIQRADNAPNIKGIILNIDSPGGQVAGTTQLADAVKGTKKPVIAMINDGMAASAAMWVASAADEIYVTKKTDMVGSVGVYTTLYDYNAYLEKEGLKVHEIYAPGSEEKNLDYREALKGNYEILQQELKVIRDEFVNTVTANRAGKLKSDEWKGGKMFFPKDAQRIGLIDGQKSFDQIVKRMDQMIATTSAKSNSNNMAFEKTLVAAKATQFAVVDGGFLLEENDLNNIEATIAAHETVAAEFGGQLAAAVEATQTAETALATANETIAARDTTITELNARIAELEKDGIGFQSTSRETDANGGVEKVPYHMSSENPFNALADSLTGGPKKK